MHSYWCNLHANSPRGDKLQFTNISVVRLTAAVKNEHETRRHCQTLSEKASTEHLWGKECTFYDDLFHVVDLTAVSFCEKNSLFLTRARIF